MKCGLKPIYDFHRDFPLKSENNRFKHRFLSITKLPGQGTTKELASRFKQHTKFRNRATLSIEPFSSKSRLKNWAVSMFTPIAANTMAKLSSASSCRLMKRVNKVHIIELKNTMLKGEKRNYELQHCLKLTKCSKENCEIQLENKLHCAHFTIEQGIRNLYWVRVYTSLEIPWWNVWDHCQ